MTREDILATTARIRDLHYFHDILTSDTPGAERAWEAMEDLNFPNPMAMTSYLLENKEFFLRYCNEEESRIRRAKTCMLMYAASIDGWSKEKDDKLTDIVDNKYRVYKFEWNTAIKGKPADAETELAELPFEERVDFVDDVVAIFKAGGDGFSEKQQWLIDRLNDVFGIEDDSDEEDTEEDVAYGKEEENDTPMTEEEVLQALEEDPDVPETWTCPNCGHTGNKGKFCSECGAKKPEVPEAWTCPKCGHSGNKGKFCSECGAKKPEILEAWTCPKCGHSGNKRKFCEECGTKRRNDSENEKTHRWIPTVQLAVQIPEKEVLNNIMGTPLGTAHIKDVKVETDVDVCGRMSFVFTIKLAVWSLKDINCLCGIWMYYSDGRPVKSNDKAYCSLDEQVASFSHFRPKWDFPSPEEVRITLPYDAILLEKLNSECFFIIKAFRIEERIIGDGFKINMLFSHASID